MNTEQLTSGLRSLVAALFAYAAGKGWISHDDALQLTPLIVTAGIVGYGIWKRRDGGLVQAAKSVKGMEAMRVDTSVATTEVANMALSGSKDNQKVTPA